MSIVQSLLENNEDAALNELNQKLDEHAEELTEARKIKVVRNGKRIKRVKPKAGYKVVGGRYKKMKSAEKIKRKKGAKRAARKRKGRSQVGANRKRAKSMRKAKSWGSR